MLVNYSFVGTARPRSARTLVLCALATAQGFVITPRQPSAPHSRQGPFAPTTRNTPVVAAFDAKGLKAAGLAALTSLALVTSPVPAYAKGGGHGGGGHSHHSSSHSRLSYPRSSTSSYRISHPSLSSSLSSSSRSRRRSGSRRSASSNVFPSAREESIRIYPTAAEARENGGLMCPATMPKVGTKVDILGGDGTLTRTATVLESQPAVQSALDDGRASLGLSFDGGCALQVQYRDGTTDTVSLAKAPPSELEEFVVNAALPVAYVAFLAAPYLDGPSARREYEQMRERLMEPRGESPSNPLNLRSLIGPWIEFQGGSSESDKGDQDIRVTLRLKRDGDVAGLGRDGVDGSYKITRGRWDVLPNGNLQLAWEESYDEGFVAICEGEYDTISGEIRARFASSRSVSGSFTLTRQ